MTNSLSITVHDTIGASLDLKLARVSAEVATIFHNGRDRLESYARENAPWSDRTGAARAGLTADVSIDGGEVVLSIFHTVDYGQWLELINDGEFAILVPSVEAVGPEVLREAGAAVLSVGIL